MCVRRIGWLVLNSQPKTASGDGATNGLPPTVMSTATAAAADRNSPSVQSSSTTKRASREKCVVIRRLRFDTEGVVRCRQHKPGQGAGQRILPHSGPVAPADQGFPS